MLVPKKLFLLNEACQGNLLCPGTAAVGGFPSSPVSNTVPKTERRGRIPPGGQKRQ